MTKKKTKAPIKLFFIIFTALAAFLILQGLIGEKPALLEVRDNAGVSVLETVGDSLVCVFQDGRTVIWDWKKLSELKGDFEILSDRTVILDSSQLAAVSKTGKKVLIVYALTSGDKIKGFSVGSKDQEVWPRISPNKDVISLVCKNLTDSNEEVIYEFQTLDLEKEILGIPVSFSIQSENEDFIDYAVDDNCIFYAVGSKEQKGRIVAIDLYKGIVLWDNNYDQSMEFCSVIVSPESQYLLAGNRDGVLYKLDTQTGEITKKIILLEDGETRPITNDYSVLNLAFSADGQYFVATITPKAYLLRTRLEEKIYRCGPADRLVSRIAFSPGNRFFATSDVRAGYPIKIWPMPETE